MSEYEKIWDFQNLYRAHRRARCGKRHESEVIEFEMDLSSQLTGLSEALRTGRYALSGYYSFQVRDPKVRTIHALHYVDRVVQHCLCDEILAPALDRRLIYDNAACRIGKGTHFAIGRVTRFLREHYRRYGAEGFFLKCDIRKFFDSIDHTILKERLRRVFTEPELLKLLDLIIDSYEASPGKGIPLGNQTSQWFAVYYLDGFDRLVKEKLRIRHYSRYMDDCLLIHPDKEYLKTCLERMDGYLRDELGLEFNRKTQIFPIRNGADYLGWHFYLSDSGKVVRRLRRQTKRKFMKKLRIIRRDYSDRKTDYADIKQVLASYLGHMKHGHTYRLREKALEDFVLIRPEQKTCDDPCRNTGT